MKYLAILGRQPELSLVELESVFGTAAVEPFGQAALLDTPAEINRLGGVQKLGRILYHGPVRDLNEAPLNFDKLPLSAGKTPFGLSYYGVRATNRFVTAAGLTLKKRLKGKGSLRLVTPQSGTALTAAQVKFNSLLRNGFELLVVQYHQKMVIALTEQLQDIDWYTARDYERPIRSAKVGMLPPKLAQIMVNTTSAPLVYDPFVGTGVVLQEALLLGRQAQGSDITAEMVAATEKNLQWLDGQKSIAPWSVTLADARQVSLPKSPVAIVSEGYLGPNLSKLPSGMELKRLQQDTLDLYQQSLKHWRSQLSRDAEITITIPVWRAQDGWKTTGIVDRLSDLGYTLKRFECADSSRLIYRRPQQIVGRQLLLLRKV